MEEEKKTAERKTEGKGSWKCNWPLVIGVVAGTALGRILIYLIWKA